MTRYNKYTFPLPFPHCPLLCATCDMCGARGSDLRSSDNIIMYLVSARVSRGLLAAPASIPRAILSPIVIPASRQPQSLYYLQISNLSQGVYKGNIREKRASRCCAERMILYIANLILPSWLWCNVAWLNVSAMFPKNLIYANTEQCRKRKLNKIRKIERLKVFLQVNCVT